MALMRQKSNIICHIHKAAMSNKQRNINWLINTIFIKMSLINVSHKQTIGKNDELNLEISIQVY